ncbi:flavin reductase family protein [Nonomuraea sp. B12E4]|uniref:flavin reductase family protein n=1 Tax=Nonomuraea sp. B12E4 TaxID=3153564 RepID=UPI00325C442E
MTVPAARARFTGRQACARTAEADGPGPALDGPGPGPGPGLDADGFRRALAVHAAGVVVITAQADGVPAGLTATSFTSVSLHPPLVSFCVDRSSTTWPSLRSADHFAVNVLAGDQAELAARFARKDVNRFGAPTRWRPGPLGAPLLQDVSAHLICLPHETVDVGDHILVVGLVAEARVHGPGRPLLYHQGRFGRFVAHPG